MPLKANELRIKELYFILTNKFLQRLDKKKRQADVPSESPLWWRMWRTGYHTGKFKDDCKCFIE